MTNKIEENKLEGMLAQAADVGKRVNREAWLWDLATEIEPLIRAQGYVVPKFHISVGFPSRNALSQKKRVIGQCYPGMISADGAYQIFVSPLIGDPVEVGGTVAHEMVHATVGTEHGHKKPFAVLARAIGLAGKITATYPGEELTGILKEKVLPKLGDYPHPILRAGGKYKPQGTRLLKAVCTECGYTARVTAKWVEQAGSLICPQDLRPLDVQGFGEIVLDEKLIELLTEQGVDLSLVNQE